jgi:Cytosolic domain of 10TM putative phosphate transporter
VSIILHNSKFINLIPSSVWFTLVHTLTTFPILFPIHVKFSDPSISSKSMTRASISSLVGTDKGLSLLWIHACLLFWVTLSWIFNLVWICTGAFRLRAANLEAMSNQTEAEHNKEDPPTYYQHPHPQYAFTAVPRWDRDCPTEGLRLRTVMISNIPPSLRSEKALQEYFEHNMSRKIKKPSVGLTSSTSPGLLNKSFAFIFNRAKRLPAHLPANPLISKHERDVDSEDGKGGKGVRRKSGFRKSLVVPKIERIVVARKMTELASLLHRREEILVQLETAHIKLANNALLAVKAAIERKEANKPIAYPASKALKIARKRRSLAVDPELADTQELDELAQMDLLIDVLRPFVAQFGTQRSLVLRSRKPVTVPSSTVDHHETTVWDALLSLPRSSLDAYQPLVNLRHLFRGKIVPSIDYYTTKLNLLTSLISDNRAKAIDEYDAVSTAFVTFADPAEARRACKYLAVHPNDPLACLVTMAPMYQDIDWIRVMKSTTKGEVSLSCIIFTLFLVLSLLINSS